MIFMAHDRRLTSKCHFESVLDAIHLRALFRHELRNHSCESRELLLNVLLLVVPQKEPQESAVLDNVDSTLV
jgi:hypothetical protein